MKTITIDVTAADIAAGGRPSAPVARAIERALPDGWRVAADDTWRADLVHPDHPAWSSYLSPPVQVWIEAFGNKHPVRPFRFAIDVPDGLAPAGAA